MRLRPGLWLLLFSGFSAQAAPRGCADEILRVIQSYSDETRFRARVDLAALEKRLRDLEAKYGMRLELGDYGEVDGRKLWRVRIPSSGENPVRVLITAGVHGNESLGTTTALDFLELALREKRLGEHFAIDIYPTVSPLGLEAGSRRIRDGLDPNRLFLPDSTLPEAVALMTELRGKSYDLALDLHGGPARQQFFLIRSGDDQGLSEEALRALEREATLPSNEGSYPGFAGTPTFPDRYRMQARGIAETSTPGTLKSFFGTLNISWAYTLEYPGAIDPREARNWNLRMVESMLEHARKRLRR